MANTSTDEVRELTIKGTDNLKFSVELIEASPGETIRMTLEVVSNMPKTAMGHNIAIVDKDADVMEFVMQSMSAKDNEYIAPALEDQVVAFTKMIGGGETSVIEFTVPEEPGDYVYVCTFPGHYFAGMKGILRVK
jgi:azurin